MEKKRSDEDREQLKREQEILGDRFIFNGCEWIELIREEDKRALEEGYKALKGTNGREIKD